MRELISETQSGLSAQQHRCVSLWSPYPFFTEIAGKFVVQSDMSVAKKVKLGALLMLNDSKERERTHTFVACP